MGPQRDGADVWFTVAEAARILGVQRQALYMAIGEGRLQAAAGPQGKRIHAKEVLAFGIQRGGDPNELTRRIQKEAKADDAEALLWLLGGLGLAWLIASLLRNK